ncbi:MAG: bifunctional hydroxymethylpyrimidine kinase/phosphomethylpyrimidine kinase [Pseudomonadales bacterium]
MNINQHSKIPVVWSISSSDSGGGTGIQADLHTYHDFETYGCTVITALAAQNSFAQGYVLATKRKSVVAQINALDSDMPAKVIKVGVLPNREILETVLKYLDDYNGFVVYDPELERSGELFSEAADLIKSALLPRSDLLIVNTQEVQAILDLNIDSQAVMVTAADKLLALGSRSVLVTGAQFDPLPGKRLDYWSDGETHFWVAIEAVDTAHNRGGGSTLSAAITASIARGLDIQAALQLAKAYVTRGIREANQLGSGPGSVAHLGMPQDGNDMPQLSVDLPVA